MSDTSPEDAPESMTIVAWSGDLDRMWPTLILGSTGAAYGMRTTIFFTFWGLFPLVRDDVRITGKNAMTKALAGMNRPGQPTTSRIDRMPRAADLRAGDQ